MMTKKKSSSRTQVRTQSTTLTALEEKVVRMRRGYAAPTSLVLEQVGQDNPDIAAQITAIEQRALAMAGPRGSAAKRKIVSSLRGKQR